MGYSSGACEAMSGCIPGIVHIMGGKEMRGPTSQEAQVRGTITEGKWFWRLIVVEKMCVCDRECACKWRLCKWRSSPAHIKAQQETNMPCSTKLQKETNYPHKQHRPPCKLSTRTCPMGSRAWRPSPLNPHGYQGPPSLVRLRAHRPHARHPWQLNIRRRIRYQDRNLPQPMRHPSAAAAAAAAPALAPAADGWRRLWEQEHGALKAEGTAAAAYVGLHILQVARGH